MRAEATEQAAIYAYLDHNATGEEWVSEIALESDVESDDGLCLCHLDRDSSSRCSHRMVVPAAKVATV